MGLEKIEIEKHLIEHQIINQIVPYIGATSNVNLGSKNLITTGNLSDGGVNSLTITNANTAYIHSQSNSQAHTDYLVNNADDTSSGILSLAGLNLSGSIVLSTGDIVGVITSVTVASVLAEGIEAIYTITTPEIDTASVYTTAATLNLQENANGDINCFEDGVISDTADSKIFYVYRNATEGKDYLSFFVDQYRVAKTQASLHLAFKTGAAGALLFDAGGMISFRDVDASAATRATLDSATGIFTLSSGQLIVATAKTPASAADTGTTGTICWDANYIYVCVATNTWKRVAIATW